MFLNALASLLFLLPSTGPIPASPRDDGGTRIIVTIPVKEIVLCLVTEEIVLIEARSDVVFAAPSMVWLSRDGTKVAIGFLAGGDGWVNLPNSHAPPLTPPGTYEMEWKDKFGRTVRVVMPCSGYTEEKCAEMFQKRV